jgi:hypothetical protein
MGDGAPTYAPILNDPAPRGKSGRIEDDANLGDDEMIASSFSYL